MSDQNSFLFLKPILTPNALATIQANPILLVYVGLAFFGMTTVITIALVTSFITNKPYKKPKAKKGAAGKGGPPRSGGTIANMKPKMGFVKGLRGKLRI